MKKGLAFLLSAAVLATALAGCGGTAVSQKSEPADGMTANSEYSEKTMKALDGTVLDLQSASGRVAVLPDAGMGVVLPENWNIAQMFFYAEQNAMHFTYFLADAESAMNALPEDATQDEITAALEAYMVPAFSLYHLTAAEETSFLAQVGERKQESERVGTLGDDVYYLAYNSDFTAFSLSETEKADLDTILAGLKNIAQFAFVFPAQQAQQTATDFADAFRVFTDETLSGETVTQDLLADYDLTMVNIWATWCGPCVGEMPELAQLYGQLPQNTNLIGICIDGADDPDTARQILSDSGATFPQLTGTGELKTALLPYISAVPTTLFVARDGSIVGERIEGAMDADSYLSELKKRLEEM